MMNKKLKRNDLLFSLCGLNCSLCPSFIRGNCIGCQEGSTCALICEIAPCSTEHGDIDYCFECGEYPCSKYDGIDEHDSLISHKNQLKDMEKAKRIGIDKYHAEQLEKRQILEYLLAEYDSGRRDVFFCLAVNLLEIDDLKNVLDEANASTSDMDLNEKSSFIKEKLISCGEKRNIKLELRK